MTVSPFALQSSHTPIPKGSTAPGRTDTVSNVHANNTCKDQPPTPSTSSIPLYTPIWDYDRFPVGPCLQGRRSHEQQNPFYIDYTQHHRPQANISSSDMIRSHSSSSSSSTSSSTASPPFLSDTGSSRHHRHASSHRHSSSRRTSCFGTDHDSNLLGTSLVTPHTNVVSPLNAADAHALAADASFSTAPQQQLATISKFDQYKAQMERLRSIRTPSSSSSVSPSPLSSSTPSPVTESSSGAGPHLSPSAKKSPGFIPKLFKKASLSKKSSRDRQPQPSSTPETRRADSATEPLFSPNANPSSSQFSLVNEKPGEVFQAQSSIPHIQPRQRPQRRFRSRSNPEKNNALAEGSEAIESYKSAPFSATTDQRSPLEEQQDRWRDEWLRPSGAIHSKFRDRPSKFNCPHCGAIKVVSHIQFVPGVMSYLVAFGLLFLTLGTLSYLPFRKDHEETKDCIHWCPECGQRVARFNRANATWEWI
ncbi:hypothetical protein BGZ54_008604 [Gamsiella multidivaricata]|nr:hypothetical protein BGZ54_008604 [Gamsiella multidivaricata]